MYYTTSSCSLTTPLQMYHYIPIHLPHTCIHTYHTPQPPPTSTQTNHITLLPTHSHILHSPTLYTDLSTQLSSLCSKPIQLLRSSSST